MPLNAGQLIVSKDTARFQVIVAGRRWGKTFLAIRKIAQVASQPNKRVFYVAPTYRQAKQIVWDQMKWRLQDLRWVSKINESDMTITLRNNSKISLRGADNPDSLRGVGLDAIVMDEFAMIDEKAWTEVLRPTLSDRQGSAMFISTPTGQANWAYDLFNKGKDPTETNWSSFQFTTLDGGNVSEDELEQARNDLDERSFRQEYLASFETYSNRLFYSFDRAHNVEKWEASTPDILHIGLDFNVGQMSGTVFALNRTQENIHVIDEIALLSSNTAEVCEEIRLRYPTQKIFVYPDPSGSARKTSAGGLTDHTILANANFTVKAPRAHNPVRDGINAVNSMLCNTKGVRRMMVDPKCKKVIESLEKHSYKTNSNIPDKDSGFDHMSDATRYFVDYMFPIKRDRDSSLILPQRWGHAIA